MRRPDRTPTKVLVKKSFNFVSEIWRAYVQSRINDLRYSIKTVTFPFRLNENCFCTLGNGERCSMKRKLNGKGTVLPHCVSVVHICTCGLSTKYTVQGHSVVAAVRSKLLAKQALEWSFSSGLTAPRAAPSNGFKLSQEVNYTEQP